MAAVIFGENAFLLDRQLGDLTAKSEKSTKFPKIKKIVAAHRTRYTCIRMGATTRG